MFNSTRLEGYDEFNMIFDMHSHPGHANWEGTKGASTGDMNNARHNRFKQAGMQNIDTWFKKDGKWTVYPKHYVYHKQSKTLYHYTPWKPNRHIRETSKASDLHRGLGL